MQILVATLRGAVHQQQRTAAYAALLPSLLQNLRGQIPKPTATITTSNTVTPLPTTPTIDRRNNTVSEISEKVSRCKVLSYPVRINQQLWI